MHNIFKPSRKSTESQISIDWIVLLAAVVGLSIAAFSTMGSESRGVITSSEGGERKSTSH